MPEDLNAKTCVACRAGMPMLSNAKSTEMMSQLNPDWTMVDQGRKLKRTVVVKGFNAAHHCANLAAYLGDQQGHHPDISFGWNYCDVIFTTHVMRGLTENDFICAARFDALVEG